jgi:hypothetical protein
MARMDGCASMGGCTHAHAPVGVGDGRVGWYLFGLK